MNRTLSPRQTVLVLPEAEIFHAEFPAAWVAALTRAVEQTTNTTVSSLHKEENNGFEHLSSM
jgi:hypothetical protein